LGADALHDQDEFSDTTDACRRERVVAPMLCGIRPVRSIAPLDGNRRHAGQNRNSERQSAPQGGEVDRMIRLMSSIFTDLWHDWLQERVEAVGLFFP